MVPMIKDHILIADDTSTKRKLSTTELDEPSLKRSKTNDDNEEKMEVDQPLAGIPPVDSPIENMVATVSMLVGEPTPNISSSQELPESEEPSECQSEELLGSECTESLSETAPEPGQTKLLPKNVIVFGEEIDPQCLPQTK